MATLPAGAPETPRAAHALRPRYALGLLALALAMLALHGYHPFAEDGGLYAAGIERLLQPGLFAGHSAFVTEHLRFSLFAPAVALLVRATRLPLDWALLLLYASSLWLTLAAGWALLGRVLGNSATGTRARWGGVLLLALWATLPVAGTSLVLLDPYLTARSLSTPLTLWAMAFALEDWRGRAQPAVACALCLAAAALLHPLMAGYALAFVLTLRLLRLRRRIAVWGGLLLLALAMAATLQALTPAEGPAAVAAALSRYYWFLSQWQWYELCGLAGPLLLLAALLRWPGALLSKRPNEADQPDALRLLVEAALGLGLLATLVALLFAREGMAAHMVARLQPLRVFLTIYAVMALLLGARLAMAGPKTLGLAIVRGAAVLAMAAAMFWAQRAVYPASAHLELPWRSADDPNRWTQAFLWARTHTPPQALFALDADYITTAGEDAQGFRALAQRSALPDFSKDGGVASLAPRLADAWRQGVQAQTGLSTESDAVRHARLLPLGVSWMVLHSTAAAAMPCPYDNGTVKVCRLTP